MANMIVLCTILILFGSLQSVEIPDSRQTEDISFSEPDDLGISLVDSSLASDLGDSLMPDDLGDSLLCLTDLESTRFSEIEISDNELECDMDLDNEHVGTPIQSSTPCKRDGRSVFDTTDLEQFSTVLATPYLKPPRAATPKLSTGGKLKAKSLREQNIMSSVCQPCKCPKQCMDSITYEHCKIMRQIYWSFTSQQRHVFLSTKVRYAEKSSKWTLITIENGLRVCMKAFGLIYNINKNSITKHRLLVQRDSNRCVRKHVLTSAKSVFCINFLEEHASMYGDRMPYSKDVLLPYKTTKKDLYKKYKQENDGDVLSESGFYTVWKRHFPHVKIKKTNTFSQCSKCASLIKKMEATLCPETMQGLKTAREEHIQRTMLERKYYYSKRTLSRKQPEDYLSIIIDGMDQSKSDLPHFTGRQSKLINGADLLKTHITGILSHGHRVFVTYLDVLQYPHDPNLSINVLLKFLLELSEKEEKLPPTLFLQMDNCYRENKNRFVFGFCELLVRQNIFSEVHISFLYSGHTHEDIDAGFSKISRKLKKNNAETISDLCQFLPNVKKIDSMLDVKSWISDSLCKVTQISQPLHYKIVGHMNSIRVYYKGQQHTLWQHLEGRGTFLRSVPSGRPKRLKPDFSKITLKVERLNKLIQTVSHMFSNEEKIMVWNDFLKNYETLFHDNSKRDRWITELPRQPVLKKNKFVVQLDSVLQQMLDKETVIPWVTCEKTAGQKKKAKRNTVNQNSAKSKPKKKVKRNTVSLNSAKSKQGKAKQSRLTGRKLIFKQTKSIKTTSKSGSSTGSNKSKTRQPRRGLFSRQVLVLVPIQEDEKKHVWVLIFLDLLNKCASLIVLVIFILKVFTCMIGLHEFILNLYMLWLKVLSAHVGHNVAKVQMELLPFLCAPSNIVC